MTPAPKIFTQLALVAETKPAAKLNRSALPAHCSPW